MKETIPESLITAARDGDRHSLELLLELVWPHAFRTARAVTGQNDLAEDAAQEACALAYRRIETLRSPSAFRAWFYRLVVREATALLRKQPSTVERRESGSVNDSGAALDVRAALAELPQNLRVVLVLHYYCELSSSEIGSALGIPAATVRFHLARGRNKLKTFLESTQLGRARNEVAHNA